MTLEEIHTHIRVLSERIHVLEAERTTEKFIQPLYEKRSELLKMITNADGVK